jgi:hypothetical protein
MGTGVPSCETCTRSYARCDDSFSEDDCDGGREGDGDEDGESDLEDTSDLRDHAESCALRSTPSTILESDGWLA